MRLQYMYVYVYLHVYMYTHVYIQDAKDPKVKVKRGPGRVCKRQADLCLLAGCYQVFLKFMCSQHMWRAARAGALNSEHHLGFLVASGQFRQTRTHNFEKPGKNSMSCVRTHRGPERRAAVSAFVYV